MDDGFPFFLINKNEMKKGTLKELTMLELENETKRLFPSEFSRCTMEYIVDDDNSLPVEEDDDIDADWAAINPESDSDSDESDDEDREEEKPKTPLRIKVIFTQKKIEIPQPVAVRVANIKSTTAVFQWKISAIHNLNETQISSLQFEIQQISPSLNKNNIHHNLVAKCNPIVGSDKCYQIKLSGLHPITNYKFIMRSVLEDSNESIYSVSCDPFDVETTKDILMKPNQIPTNIEPSTGDNTNILLMQIENQNAEIQRLKDDKLKLNVTINALKQQIEVWEHEKKEYEITINELKQEIKEMRIDTKNFTEWDPNDVLNWILSIENGVFAKYEEKLKQEIMDGEIMGNDLITMNVEDLKNIGVMKFGHRKLLYSYIEALTNKNEENMNQIEKEGINPPTAYI